MVDFDEQYELELKKQEISANKRTLKASLITFVTLTFIWMLVLLRFFVIDTNIFHLAYGITFLAWIPIFVIYKKADLSKAWIKYFLLIAMCLVSSVIEAFLTFHAVLICILPLLLAIQYKKSRTLWITYGVDIALMPVSLISGFYHGICDLNILFDSNHTRSWYLLQMAEGPLKVSFNKTPVFVIMVYGFLPRAIILLAFTIILQYTISSNQNDAYRIADLTYLREIDSATRLYNKNKYEEMISYYMTVEHVAAIVWDVNNLKEINDRMGHSMGDKLIETLSYAIYVQSSHTRRAYRIGGDEFVMLIENPKENEAVQIVESVQKQLEKKREEGGLKVSSAVGYAEGNGIDVLRIVHEADEQMYENKKKCKESRECCI